MGKSIKTISFSCFLAIMESYGVFYRDDNYVFITRENDILIEVNGVNVEKTKHQDVVDKIR